MKSILVIITGALVVVCLLARPTNSSPYQGYLFPGDYPFTDLYGNVGDIRPAPAYGGYGVGQGYPFYPLGYGGYGNLRSYAVGTAVPGGVFGHDGCGCDGYGKYGCGC